MIVRIFGILFLILTSLDTANAGYVGNDPLNYTDPSGLCMRDSGGNAVSGVCGTDEASQALLTQTEGMSSETANADQKAQEMGVLVPFTFDPSQTGGRVEYARDSDGNPVVGEGGNLVISAVYVGRQGGAIISALDASGSHAETINYLNGPHELTGHEVGGHVNDALTGARLTMSGEARDFLPRCEVRPLKAENQVRSSVGIRVYRRNYDAPIRFMTTPSGTKPAPHRTALDYLAK